MNLYPSILSRFLSKRFFKNFFSMLGIVVGITFTVSFINEMTRSSAVLQNSLMETGLQILEWVPIFLPIVVFLSVLLTTWQLTRNSELPIIVGAGLSPIQWMKSFMYSAFFIGLVATTIVNPMYVHLSSAYEKHYVNSETSNDMLLLDGKIWIREQNSEKKLLIEAGNVNLNKNRMIFKDVILLVQDSKYKLLNRIEAPYAVLSNNRWIISEPVIYDTQNHIFSQKNWETSSSLSADCIYDRYLKSSQISFWKLPGFIQNLNKTVFNTRSHEIQFFTLLFQPFLLLAMVVLGIVFSLTKQARNFSFGLKFSLGILTSFILYFFTNIFVALGTSGFLPPIIAVIVPSLIILFFGIVYILNFDS